MFAEDANLLSLLALLLVVSVLVNLFLFNARLIDKKRKNSPYLFKKKLIQFYKEQSRKTLQWKRDTSIPPLDPLVSSMRGAYMMIESKAVERGIDSREYWNLINEKLKSLIAIVKKYDTSPTLNSIKEKVVAIKKIVTETVDADERDAVISSLDNFYRACRKNPKEQNLKRFDKKLNAILDSLKETNLEAVENGLDAVSTFSSHAQKRLNQHMGDAGELEAQLEKYSSGDQKRVAELIGQYAQGSQQIEDSLNTVVDASNRAGENLSEIILRGDVELEDSSNHSGDATMAEMMEISEELQKKSEDEIVRLKSVVKEQKSTIYELEEQLASSSKKSSVKESPQEREVRETLARQIQLLKGSLNDSERCVETLEAELDEMRAKFSIIRREAKKEQEDAASLNRIDELLGKIKQLENDLLFAESESKYLGSMQKFFKDAVNLGSIEDLAMHVYTSISDLGFAAKLLVKGGEREFIVSPSGRMDKSDLVILKNMMVYESSRNSSSTKLFARYKNFSAALSGSDGGSISDIDAINLCAMMEVGDGLINKILDYKSQQSKSKAISHAYDSFKLGISSADQMLNSSYLNLSKSIQGNFTDTQKVLRAQGASASNVARLRQLEQELLREIESEKNVVLRVKRTFLKVLNDIERLE